MDSFTTFFPYHFPRLCHSSRSSSSASSSYLSASSSSDEDIDMPDAHRDRDLHNDELRDKLTPLLRFDSEDLPKRVRQVTPPFQIHSAPALPVGGTPHKQNLSSVETSQGYNDERVERYLADQFLPITQREYPIVDFIEKVYGIDAAHLYKPSKVPIHIKKNDIKEFSKGGGVGERGSYDAFIKIMLSLVRQMGLSRERNKFHVINGKDRILDSQFVDNKPDVLMTMDKLGVRQSWCWQALVFELSRRLGHSFSDHIEVDWDLISEEKQENSAATGEKRKFDNDAQLNAPSSAKRPKVDDATDAASAETAVDEISPEDEEDAEDEGDAEDGEDAEDREGAEDEEDAEDEDDLEDEDDMSQGDGPKFTRKERQALKYINQLMSSGVRSYATLVLVQKATITLWYCDRMGLIISRPFNFVEEPHYLALLSAAILTADLPQLGVCPFLFFRNSRYTTFQSAVFRLETAKDADGEIIPGGVELKVHETSKRKLHNGFGAIGRGTAVLPLQIPPALSAKLGTGDSVAKVAWPLKERPAEASLIRIVRDKLKADKEGSGYLRHIPELKCYSEYTAQELGLPRSKMGYAEFMDGHERVLRVMIMKAYLPLRMVDSIDEFKTIFIGVVQGHHWAWEVAEVLHRDISVENIMFYRTKSEVVGVLNDWDYAEKKSNLPLVEFNLLNAIEVARKNRWENEQGAPDDSDVHSDPPHVPTEPADEVASRSESEPAPVKQARYRTGTGPFMAIELLQSGPIYPFHRYRFDLESFCYVLVWFCLGFNPKKRKVAHIDTWKHGGFKQIALAKLRYVQSSEEQKDLWNRAKSKQYLDLYKTWADPLVQMVCTVQDSVRDIERIIEKACRMSPKGVSEKLEEWKTEIRGYELAREQALTYEQVMAILVK